MKKMIGKMMRESFCILLIIMMVCSTMVFANATTEPIDPWTKIYTDDFSNWQMTGNGEEASATFDADGAYMERLIAGGANSYLSMKSMPTAEQLGGKRLSGKLRLDFTYEVPTDKKFYLWMSLGPVAYQESSSGTLADGNWVAIRDTQSGAGKSNAVQVPLNGGKREISLEFDFDTKTYTGSINGVALKRSGGFWTDSLDATNFERFIIEMRTVNNKTEYGEIGTSVRVSKLEFYKIADEEDKEILPTDPWTKIYTDDFGNWQMTGNGGEASATFDADGAYMERLIAGGANSYLSMKSMPTAEQLGGKRLSGKLRLDFTYEVPTDKKFYLWMSLGPVAYQESSSGTLADGNWVAIRDTQSGAGKSNAVQVPLNGGKREISLEFDFDTKTYTGSINGVALKRSGGFWTDSLDATNFERFIIEMRTVNNKTEYGEIGTSVRVSKLEFYKIDEVTLFNPQFNGNNVSVSLSNTYQQDVTVYVVLAGYDGKGILCNINMQSVDLTSNDKTKLVSAEFTNNVSAGGSVAAFVWKDVSGISPLCKPVQLEIQ